ncbi:MAG: TetR family transcriptional regulator [Actinomycetales bacterium]
MSSAEAGSRGWRGDDLTPQARIRHAAMELFGEKGFERTTVRAIAARAGVSAPLVIHHFGSKDGLRRACDEWMMRVLSEEKTLVISGGSLPQLQSYLANHPELAPLLGYLVATLRHGGAPADDLFDRLCDLTADLFDTAEAAGTMRIPQDRQAAIAILVAFGCGASLLGDQIARRLGGRSLLDPEIYERYGRTSLDVYTHGLFPDDRYLRALDETQGAAPAHPPSDARTTPRRKR